MKPFMAWGVNHDPVMIPTRLTLVLGLVLMGFWGTAQQTVRLGADRFLEPPYRQWIEHKRVGLITNPSGVNSQLIRTADLLAQDPALELVALYGPEHGLSGDISAGQPVTATGHVYSLYGKTRKPTPEMLKDVEVLLYDIQDVGVRFYTYISTLYLAMQAAAEQGIPFVVLDRPNPIGGDRVEGPMLEVDYQSFVGIFPLPVRYGMTAGELAQMFNQEAELGCDLRVVPMSGWTRELWYDETNLEWVPPSPNMPTLQTATIYPGSCLLEGTNLSEGRGTTRPFEWIGAPWLDAGALAARLHALELPGVRFREQSFSPGTSKYQSETCRGVQIHVLDRAAFQPIPTVLHLLRAVNDLHPGQLEWKPKLFDRLAGSSRLRTALQQGDGIPRIVQEWNTELDSFLTKRKKYLIYR